MILIMMDMTGKAIIIHIIIVSHDDINLLTSQTLKTKVLFLIVTTLGGINKTYSNVNSVPTTKNSMTIF